MSDRHRDSDGVCRECGRYALGSAPTSCARCALELARQAGAEIVSASELRTHLRCHQEHWMQVADDLVKHRIHGGRFYVYGSADSGERLEQPPHLRPYYLTRTAAIEAARGQLARYPHIWVATSVGAFRVTNDVKLT